ncbi:MAG: uroporphyrinogen decarboxylase family protein [Candidatus Bathyarchaeota archaeon]|nr:uroporphyrinogen decarboxylase family protein [Candidatus Bathyarchaeota archaeon]
MMIGKERILAAFGDGSPEDIPSVLNYAHLALWRGPHFWNDFAEGKQWWIKDAWDISELLEVEETMQRKLDMDWVWGATLCPSREWRKNHIVIPTARAVYMRDITPGASIWQYIIEEPPPEGIHATYPNVDLSGIIKTKEDVEKYVLVQKAEALIEEGKTDLVEALVKKFGNEKFVLSEIDSPLEAACDFMGPVPSIKLFMKNPALLKQLVDRKADAIIEEIKAHAKMGSDGVWTWEWYTGEIISPAQFEAIGKPAIQRCIRIAQQLGLKYIFYPTGVGKDWQAGFESILGMKPDGIHLEESKKGFDTDVSWQANVLKSRGLQDVITLFGNVDAVNVVQEGTSEELEREVKQQIDVGRNEYGGRFVMDVGSPITPETSLERLIEYMNLVRKHSRKKD